MTEKTIVKYKDFEVICYPETLTKFRNGQLTMEQTYLVPTIFKNSSKGNVAKSDAIKKAFGTTDAPTVLNEILKKGDFKLTTNELKQLNEKKRREIINYVHTSYLNPKNNLPHSLSLIDSALTQSKLSIDHRISADTQFEKHRKKFITILPIKAIESVDGKLLIPYKSWNTKGVQAFIHQSVKIYGENHDTDGLTLDISLNQNRFDGFMGKLIKLTDNNFTFVSISEGRKMEKTELSKKQQKKTTKQKKKKRGW